MQEERKIKHVQQFTATCKTSGDSAEVQKLGSKLNTAKMKQTSPVLSNVYEVCYLQVVCLNYTIFV